MHFMSEEQNKPIIQKCEKCGKENETVHANFLLYGFMVLWFANLVKFQKRYFLFNEQY